MSRRRHVVGVESIKEENNTMIKYFNIEYSGGQYHLFINGVLSYSTESAVVEDELKAWIDDINRGCESHE